jgi:hypothetical protein
MAFPPVAPTLFIEIIESLTDKCQYKCKYKVYNVIKRVLIATPGIAFVQKTICGIEGHGEGLGQERPHDTHMAVAIDRPL